MITDQTIQEIFQKKGKATVTQRGAGMSVIDKPTWPANIIRPLRVGEEVKIFERENGHVRIGKNRWIFQDYLFFHHMAFVRTDGKGADVFENPTDLIKFAKQHLERGAGIVVTDEYGDYYKIGYGWVEKKNMYLTRVGVINKAGEGMSTLMLPTWPAECVHLLPPETMVVICEEQNGHYRVGQNEWIFKDYVDLQGEKR